MQIGSIHQTNKRGFSMKTTIPIKVNFGAASPINQSINQSINQKNDFLRQKMNITKKRKTRDAGTLKLRS